jgi:hypothetical protein
MIFGDHIGGRCSRPTSLAKAVRIALACLCSTSSTSRDWCCSRGALLAQALISHLYFWQATLILTITCVWLLWIFKVVRHAPRARPDTG